MTFIFCTLEAKFSLNINVILSNGLAVYISLPSHPSIRLLHVSLYNSVELVANLLRTLEVSGSNLGLKTGYNEVLCVFLRRRDSSVGIGTVDRKNEESWFDSRQGQEIFLLSTASRKALGSTQPPIQWVRGALSPGVKRAGAKLTIYFHLVKWLRIRGAIPPLPYQSRGD
jgi:hypothetical protein